MPARATAALRERYRLLAQLTEAAEQTAVGSLVLVVGEWSMRSSTNDPTYEAVVFRCRTTTEQGRSVYR